jgi:N-acetylglutamate synthase-like GNAT family acetyltransferase
MISSLTSDSVVEFQGADLPLEIRKAGMSDIAPLLRLINDYAAKGIMLPRTEFEMSENIRDFSVIYSGAELIGCGALHFYSPIMGEVRSLAVDPAWKAHGIGRRMVETLVVEARLFSLDAIFAFTYVADFGKTLATLGTHDEALGQVWHVPSNPPVTQAEFVAMIQDAVGKPVKIQRGTAPVLWLVGLGNPDARETIEMLYEFERPFVMESEKFQRAFDIKPTSLREAIQATVDWARTHPQAR